MSVTVVDPGGEIQAKSGKQCWFCILFYIWSIYEYDMDFVDMLELLAVQDVVLEYGVMLCLKCVK